jgi:hypothetical protein
MRWHRLCLAILVLAAAFDLPSTFAWGRRREDVAKLREQIQRQKNPVKKAKLEIRLARFELQQVVAAYDHNQAMQGRQLLGNYLQEMNESWSMLKNSGRNAAKSPSGFMQLEIALRENARVLTDLRDRVAYLDEAPIERTLGVLNQLHSRVLLALFPGAVSPGATAQKPPKTGTSSFATRESHR